MTEQHEIDSIIDDLTTISNEINYEINTTPGESEEFVRKLKESVTNVRLAIKNIEDSKNFIRGN